MTSHELNDALAGRRGYIVFTIKLSALYEQDSLKLKEKFRNGCYSKVY